MFLSTLNQSVPMVCLTEITERLLLIFKVVRTFSLIDGAFR